MTALVFRIELTQGQWATVDQADFEQLSAHKWYAHWDKSSKSFYAQRKARDESGKQRTVLMHREITGAKPGEVVDHISRDTLDNRRGNLRCCGATLNAWNRTHGKLSKTGYRGVYPHGSKWQAKICVNGNRIHLGNFGTPEEAAEAYDKAAVEHFKEFAQPNLILAERVTTSLGTAVVPC